MSEILEEIKILNYLLCHLVCKGCILKEEDCIKCTVDEIRNRNLKKE